MVKVKDLDRSRCSTWVSCCLPTLVLPFPLQGVVKVKDLDAGTEEVVPLGEVTAVLAERVKSKADRRIVYAAQKAEEQKA